jgi:hypothetical protein
VWTLTEARPRIASRAGAGAGRPEGGSRSRGRNGDGFITERHDPCRLARGTMKQHGARAARWAGRRITRTGNLFTAPLQPYGYGLKVRPWAVCMGSWHLVLQTARKRHVTRNGYIGTVLRL